MQRDKQLKKEIFKKIREYYKTKFGKKVFIPGETLIPPSGKVFDEKEMISLVDSALDFWLTEGRFAKKFEQEFSKYLKVPYTILTNSGSSANLLAFSALTSPELEKKRIKPGDEVITVAATFPTTVNPIIQNGCVPVFLDINLETLNIDSSKIEKAITKRTKAIFLAHSLGNPFDLKTVIKVAKKYNLFVVEDACDALGATYNNQLVGTFGDIGTFSFYPAHQITMGEGGAVVTKNPLLKKIIRSFRDWGRDCWCDSGHDNTCGKRFGWKLGKLPFGYDHKYIYSHLGYNLKVTDMQPAIGIAQLKKLPKFIEIREKNFEFLYKNLKKYENYFIFLKATPDSEPCWFGFPLTIRKNAWFSRSEMVNYLEKNKIATRMLFGGNITKQPYFKDVNYRIFDNLENTDFIMDNTFWIGVYPGLTKQMIDYILIKFKEFLKNK
jgi:CDP-6-deoxy-D-xylo-4-hexulose-3-dehydrase